MSSQRLYVLAFAFFFASVALIPGAPGASAAGTLKPQAQAVPADAFSGRHGMAPGGDGLTPDGEVGTAETAVTEAPAPFSYLMLRWRATADHDAVVEFEARTSEDRKTWTAWGPIHEDHDLVDPKEDPEIHWSGVIYAGPSKYWQLRVRLGLGDDGEAPVLHEARVSTVDPRFADASPSTTRQAMTSATVSRPAFVSRAAWGGSEVLNNSVAPQWRTATHLVVHHSADQNYLRTGEHSWADRVRAIWAFHTYSSGRGWGDVGYNWLVDPNGVIYEGRNGSADPDRDSVGFHDTGNYGSMGVVILGTFESTGPTAAAQDGVVRTLAWKASQRGIDPMGSSFYYGCSISSYCKPYNSGSIVPNIAGHRQVTPGHTACPGDLGLAAVNSIRSRVRDALGGSSDNGDTTIDERESRFERSANSWHSDSCGFDSSTYWTYATDGAVENWARWRPNLPQRGRYHLYASRPQGCSSVAGKAVTGQARYRVEHANGTTTVVRSQAVGDPWIDLGSYDFNAGTAGSVYLDDATGEPFSSGRVIFFDAIRWVSEAAPPPPPPPPPPSPTARAAITNVEYAGLPVEAGGVVQVRFTVKNTGDVPLGTQDPQPGRTDDVAPGWVYDENECFLGNSSRSYPLFPKQTGRLRIVLGGSEGGRALGADCAGDTSGYPWRWGIGGDLQPGQTTTVVGYVRFRNQTSSPRTITLRPSLVNESVEFFTPAFGTSNITVNPDRRAPELSATDVNGLPLASVYRLIPVPDNHLARSVDPASAREGELLGTFTWDGAEQSWGRGGPLGQTDRFVINHARAFLAPRAGVYTFELTSDDGSWLWVDGRVVVTNEGLHSGKSISGSTWLPEGVHILGVKYFDHAFDAYVRYNWIPPGATTFSTIPVLDTAPRLGDVFGVGEQLTIAADDLGGLGTSKIVYNVDGGSAREQAGALLKLALADGYHQVTYRAVDRSGAWSLPRTASFSVDSTPPKTTLTTRLRSDGVIWLEWTSSPDALLFDLQSFDTARGAWKSMGKTSRGPLAFFGAPGHTYRFRIRGSDGLNWETFQGDGSTPRTVPARARFWSTVIPVIP